MAAQPPIFVISLPHCAERRRGISARLAGLGLDFSFIDGIGGRETDPTQHPLYAGRRRRLFFGKDLTRGEYGCLLSHRAVYRHMDENGIERALVLEDDAVLLDSLTEVIAACLQTPVPWDLVRFLGSDKYYRRCRAIAPLCGPHELTRVRTTPGGAYGYLLNRTAAQKLLDHMHRNWLPVDVVHGQVWRTGLDVFCVRPSPVLHDHDVPSIIGAQRFDKNTRLSGWERAAYPWTRAALKIYESAGKVMMDVMNRRREMAMERVIHPLREHQTGDRPPRARLHADSPRPSR
jgi:glycosyl transferase, family 25